MNSIEIKKELDRVKNIIDNGYLNQKIFSYYNALVAEFNLMIEFETREKERLRLKKKQEDLEDLSDLDWVVLEDNWELI